MSIIIIIMVVVVVVVAVVVVRRRRSKPRKKCLKKDENHGNSVMHVKTEKVLQQSASPSLAGNSGGLIPGKAQQPQEQRPHNGVADDDHVGRHVLSLNC